MTITELAEWVLAMLLTGAQFPTNEMIEALLVAVIAMPVLGMSTVILLLLKEREHLQSIIKERDTECSPTES